MAVGSAYLFPPLSSGGASIAEPLLRFHTPLIEAHKRRVVAKVEWHPGELVPRVGLDPLRGSSVTNLSRPAERVTGFYDGRGTAEQYIKEGKNAINGTRLSCHAFRNNEVRLQLHALAYNLGNFLRTLALPEAVAHWSLTTLRA